MSNIVFFNSQDVMAEFDTYYAEDYRAWGQLYPAMERDGRFYLGDQWYLQEINAMREEGRYTTTINKTKAKIDWINGVQIQNRMSPMVYALQGGSEATADQFTKTALYVLDKYKGYRNISETFSAGNKWGWNLLNVYMDYNTDPVNGDINFARDPYSGFIMSAYFSRQDLTDCDHVIKRKYIAPNVAATLLPGQEDEVMSLARDGWERDNKFTWMVFQRQPTGQRMMAYNEFFRLKFEPQKCIVNKMTRQFVDWNGDRQILEQVKAMADQLGHEIEIISRKKQVMEKHIILNNYYMRTEINPYGLAEYPFCFYAPVWEPESEEYTFKVQSLVRQLIDPARERNKRRSQMIDVVESQLNSGWIEEDGVVKNPQMLYQSGQGKRIVLNADKNLGQLKRIDPAIVPPSYFQEIAMCDKDEMDILGINETSMGMQDSKQVSALVEMHRQKAGLVAMEDVFDRLSQLQCGITEKVIKMSQTWSPDKLRKILGEEPTPEYFDKDMTKYHVTVSEGVLTNTQRNLFFRQVLELKQLGEPVPPGELTKLAPLQGKPEFLKDVQAYAKQQEQQMQQLQQSEQMETQSLAQSLQARSMSDLALAKERQARAIANLGLEDERVSKSLENRELAALNHVKSVQELAKLSTDHSTLKDEKLMGIMRFLMDYENHLKGQENLEKVDNKQVSQNTAQEQV